MKSCDHLVFLQNAWSPVYAGTTWPRQAWLKALKKSRAGQRLRLMINDFDCCENCTPEVSFSPAGHHAPDREHIKEILEHRKPKLVVACGSPAGAALWVCWDGPIIIMPHPSYRLLTNELVLRVGELIQSKFRGKVEISQLRGRFDEHFL
jgi:hypothetical protein